MYLSAVALLLAACAVGAPTASSLAGGTAILDAKVVDQGDGFYLAKYNNITGVHDVKFTPLTALIARADVEERTVEPLYNLAKRGVSHACSGRYTDNTANLDAANRQLATNAGNHGQYEKHDWGWVRDTSVA